MQEVLDIPDSILHDLLVKAECHSSFRNETGVWNRRRLRPRSNGWYPGAHFRGPWGAPAMYALEGSSIGFQIGGEATDLILLGANGRGMESILSSKVKLGADASCGRRTQRPRCFRRHRRMDEELEILSYSRSRGVFAGISLEGSTPFVPMTMPANRFMVTRSKPRTS